jgi:hypothetical protein
MVEVDTVPIRELELRDFDTQRSFLLTRVHVYRTPAIVFVVFTLLHEVELAAAEATPNCRTTMAMTPT